MTSRNAVTPESVKRVAYRLYAPMSDELARQIAQAAEEVSRRSAGAAHSGA